MVSIVTASNPADGSKGRFPAAAGLFRGY